MAFSITLQESGSGTKEMETGHLDSRPMSAINRLMTTL